MEKAFGSGQDRPARLSPTSQHALRSALEPLEYVQQNLPVVRRVMDRLVDLLPPQIDTDEMVAQLVLRLIETCPDVREAAEVEEDLWQHALVYLRRHPALRAAQRWVADRAWGGAGSAEDLREAALALTVFADRWLPGEAEGDEELLAQALARLGTYERLAMALYFYDGMTLPEIGEVLDLPPDEVAALYGTAMRQLRRNLAEVSLMRKAA